MPGWPESAFCTASIEEREWRRCRVVEGSGSELILELVIGIVRRSYRPYNGQALGPGISIGRRMFGSSASISKAAWSRAMRKLERLAELIERLVDREAGRVCRNLEEDTARLAEIDRVEVVAIDLWQ